MYGPGPEPGQPQPRRASRAMIVTIRVVVVAITVLTAFLMSWIPVLRVAIVRRRGKDWALFWAVLAVSLGCLAMLEERFSKTTHNVGMIAAICVGSLSVAYYLWADIRHFRPPARAAAPGGHPPPYAATLPGAPQPGYQMERFPGADQGVPQARPYPYSVAHPQHPAPQALVPEYHPGRTRPGPEAAPYGQPAGYPPHAAPHVPAPPQSGYGYPPLPEAPPRTAPAQGRQDVAHRPPERIRQVRAELDELSDLLRKEAGEQGERGQ